MTVNPLTFSAVEQWPARRAHNPEVAGSNPARATNFKLNTMTEIKETYLDVRIEQMLIAKIAHYRLNIREGFRERHKGFRRIRILHGDINGQIYSVFAEEVLEVVKN